MPALTECDKGRVTLGSERRIGAARCRVVTVGSEHHFVDYDSCGRFRSRRLTTRANRAHAMRSCGTGRGAQTGARHPPAGPTQRRAGEVEARTGRTRDTTSGSGAGGAARQRRGDHGQPARPREVREDRRGPTPGTCRGRQVGGEDATPNPPTDPDATTAATRARGPGENQRQPDTKEASRTEPTDSRQLLELRCRPERRELQRRRLRALTRELRGTPRPGEESERVRTVKISESGDVPQPPPHRRGEREVQGEGRRPAASGRRRGTRERGAATGPANRAVRA